MDETPILVEKRDGFRVITLNRPARLNAFTEDMHLALQGGARRHRGGFQLPRAC